MTSGNTSIDTRVLTSFPWTNCSGSGFLDSRIGWKTTKSWGGADYSSSSKPDKNVRYRDRDHPYQGRYSSYGRQVAPRRSKIEDHGYSMVALTEYNGVCTWLEPMGPCAPGVKTSASCGHIEAFGTFEDHQTWVENDYLSLLGKLREKTTGSTFNAGVAAAESAQGLVLLAETAGKINRAYGHARRGQIGRAWQDLTGVRPSRSRRRRFLEGRVDAAAVAQNWLELQYGWKPLLSDVFDACASLAHFLNTPLCKTYRTSKKKAGYATGGYPYGHWGTEDVYYRVGIIARVREASVVQLLGLTDPTSIAWEKLPFSFVADWFIPIGAWLSARGLAGSLTATYVISRKRYCLVGDWTMTGAGAITYSSFTSEYKASYAAFSREVTSSLEVPLPTLKALDKWATWIHAANATGLLVANHSSSGSPPGIRR